MTVVPGYCNSQTVFTILFSAKKGHRTCRLQTLSVSYFYAPEAHIMYLTISSSFLISFVMGESGPSRVIKFLYSPGPPPPTVWALDLPKNTLLKSPGGSSFLGPKWHSPIGSMPFHRTQKISNSRAPQPPPTSPRNGYARIKNIMHGAV